MPEPQKIDISAVSTPRDDDPNRVAYYRLKADECLERAQTTKDRQTRDYCLGLANTWTRLSMIPERLKLL